MMLEFLRYSFPIIFIFIYIFANSYYSLDFIYLKMSLKCSLSFLPDLSLIGMKYLISLIFEERKEKKRLKS